MPSRKWNNGTALATRALDTAQRGAELTDRPRQAVWHFIKAVRAELSDPLTPVLALGSAASAVLGSPVDAVLVGSVLTGNSILAASQRLRAESRLNELLAQQIPPARKVTVGADGSPVYTDVKAAQLRPGDVIEVRTHEVVPADARLIEEEDLEVDESSLTGESLPVEKQVDSTPGAVLAERRCMLYGGTTIVAGTAVALVTAVGADTQARRAAELVSGELPQIGLEHQLSQLTNRAFPVSVTGGLLVSGLGLLRGRGLRQAVASGIAITVAAVPEGMPLVATLAQAASARRLTNYGALVRVPRSVEALGRIDVVCFDKTGHAVGEPAAGVAGASRRGLLPRRRAAIRGECRTGRQRRTAGARDRPRDHRGGAPGSRRQSKSQRTCRSGPAGRSRRRCPATS